MTLLCCRGGRGGSSRGRDDMSGYNNNPRPGHQAGVPPQRNATHVYQPRQHNNVIPGQVNPVEPAGQPRPEPPRPAPEFNMKANDFPSLPGVPEPQPNTEPARFLDVVKGTSKMKLEDDQETLPDDFISDEVEPEHAVEADPVSVSPKSRSKHSS